MPLDPHAVNPAAVLHHLSHKSRVMLLRHEMQDDVTILLVVVEKRPERRLEVGVVGDCSGGCDADPFAFRHRLE